MKKPIALLLTLGMVLSLTACGGGDKPSAGGESAGSGAAGTETGGSAGNDAGSDTGSAGSDTADRDDLTVILGAEFSTLDPLALPSVAEINFCSNIFDGLVTLDAEGKVQPMLASDWDVSEDGLSYTFHLREGITFHNGDEMDAEDVKLSVDRFIEESWMQFASFAVKDCEIVDDHTVTINLKYAYGNFLSMLWYCAIIDADYYNSVSTEEFARNPIGTGAYKFVEWTAGQNVKLTANEEYWNGAPSIKNLTFNFIADTNTALVALETGEADMAFGTALSAVTFQQAQSNEKLATDSTVGNSFYYTNFNSSRIPKEVRQALSYAIDRETLNVMITEGTGYVGDMALVEGQEGYTTDVTTYPYDPEKAKQLLAEAGAEDLVLTFYYGESTDNTKLGETLQAQLSAVGVTLELEPVESGTWWATFEDGGYDISRGGYPMEIANTDSAYYDMFHSTGTFNVSRISNPEIDALLDEARTELDSAKRNEIYIKVNQILAEEAYFVPLYFQASTVVYNAGLKGVSAVPTQKYMYKDFSWN